MNLMLGDYNLNAPPKRTPLGILFYPYGLDDYGPKRINKKAVKRMTVAGVTPYIIEQFKEWALRLPAELPAWIDAAYNGRLADWRMCVGQRLPNGNRIDRDTLDDITPRSFHIKLHPAPFPVPQDVLTAGASWKDRIEVVIAFLDQQNTWLRKCDDLIQWELGNLFGIRHDYRPQDPSQEVGNKNPCS